MGPVSSATPTQPKILLLVLHLALLQSTTEWASSLSRCWSHIASSWVLIRRSRYFVAPTRRPDEQLNDRIAAAGRNAEFATFGLHDPTTARSHKETKKVLDQVGGIPIVGRKQVHCYWWSLTWEHHLVDEFAGRGNQLHSWRFRGPHQPQLEREILIDIISLEPGRFSVQKARMNNQLREFLIATPY